MKNSKLILPVIALGAVVLGGALYSAKALADDATAKRGPDTAALAQKLGIEQSKVDNAMNEVRAERQRQRQEQVSSKLDEAVKDGAITPTQKQSILDKLSEVQGRRGEKRSELEQWFKDNGIDSGKIHSYIGFGNGNGNGMGRKGLSQ